MPGFVSVDASANGNRGMLHVIGVGAYHRRNHVGGLDPEYVIPQPQDAQTEPGQECTSAGSEHTIKMTIATDMNGGSKNLVGLRDPPAVDRFPREGAMPRTVGAPGIPHYENV